MNKSRVIFAFIFLSNCNSSLRLIYIFVKDFFYTRRKNINQNKLKVLQQRIYKMESNQFPYFTTSRSVISFDRLFSFFGFYYGNFRTYYRFYWYS